MPSSFRTLPLGLLLLTAPVGRGEVALPPNVLDPPTAAEAWNIIRLSTANVDRLLQEKRVGEVALQISLSSAALRTLAREKEPPERSARLTEQTQRGLQRVGEIAASGRAGDSAAVARGTAAFRLLLAEMAREFDPKIVAADVFLCPMHAEFAATDPATPCAKCGMHLVPRRIPHSLLSIRPGEPATVLSATVSGLLVAGKKADVKVQIKRRDGAAVQPGDLMVMHTQPIHLLIVDPSLNDYHHEHPTPTATPGEYAFSFTPKKSSSYRLWADLVPMATGVQEYPGVTLEGSGPPEEIGDRSGCSLAIMDGLKFQLTFAGDALPRVGQVGNLRIDIAEAAGRPITRLEPLMNAFAHLVGFYDDGQTIVHLHPEGGDILDQALRGGPMLSFKFHPPKAGFLRLFCQVVVDGRNVFAPFSVNVAP